MEMTIRKAISEMRKVCTSTVYLNNGTKIFIQEINADKSDYIGTIKWDENGRAKVLRRIFCTILPTSRTKMLDDLKNAKYVWLYNPKEEWNYFGENDYCVPERMMNEFIIANGEIDTYRSISAPYYMMVDTLSMFDDMEA